MKVLQDFEYIDVDVWDKSSKECKEYNAKVHPHASIPALELQDTTIIQSGVICVYLAESYQQCLPHNMAIFYKYVYVTLMYSTLHGVYVTVWHLDLYLAESVPTTTIICKVDSRSRKSTLHLIQKVVCGAVVVVIVWQLDLQLPMQPVPITTDVVSSNLDQGEVYNIMQ